MFERLSASMALARSSWQVLSLDKQLILFPVLSGMGCFLVLLSFAAPFVLDPALLDFLNQRGVDGQNQVPIWVYAVAFAFYFCNYFIIIFFNAALISCALIRFNGGTPTVADGLQAAGSRLPQVLAWSLVSATVGMLLKAVENSHEKAGQFISGLLGTAWTALTYFVVPVLVVEKVGPIQAISRSMALLRKTWGEALIGRMGIGFFLFLLAIPGIALMLIAAMMLTQQQLVLGLLLLALGMVYFVILSAVGSALNGIFVGALYQYAASGVVPQGFERGTLERVFAPKN